MTVATMKIRLRYVGEDVDAHGNVRLYVRMPGRKKVRIRETPGTAAFMEAYAAAVAASEPSRPSAIDPRSIRWLYDRYTAGGTFKRLDASTQEWQCRALNSICAKHGTKPFARMEARHVRAIRDERSSHPAAANHRLKALRALFAWANETDMARNNPTLGVKGVRYTVAGHHTWTEEERLQYETRHPIGTQARLAYDLIRYTTGRREDAVRLGRQHIKNGRVRFRQAKNEHRKPVDIDIPAHPNLLASIEAAAPRDALHFLQTAYGRAFSVNGFGNKFKDWCRQAGLPHCTAHGVRKSTLTEIAENDGTPHQIMAVSGHRTLSEVERYTRKARAAKLATAGMAKVK